MRGGELTNACAVQTAKTAPAMPGVGGVALPDELCDCPQFR